MALYVTNGYIVISSFKICTEKCLILCNNKLEV